MPTIEERVAMIEGRLLEQSQMFSAIRQDIAGIRQETAGMRQELADFRRGTDQRFASVDQRFASIEQKMSTQFYCLLGAQMTTILAIIAALLKR